MADWLTLGSLLPSAQSREGILSFHRDRVTILSIEAGLASSVVAKLTTRSLTREY